MQKTFCLFSFHQDLKLGIVNSAKKKWEVQTKTGKYQLTKNSILYAWEQPIVCETSMFEYLEKWQRRYEDFSADLTTIYEICNEQKPYALAELAAFALPSDKQDASSLALLYCYLLKEGEEFFFHKNGFFERKTELERAAYQEQQKQQEEKKKIAELEGQWARSLKLHQKPTPEKNETKYWESFQKRLTDFANEPHQHPEKDYFQKLFSLQLEKKEDPQDYAFLKVMESLQNPITWGMWQAKKAGVCEKYDRELFIEAEALKQNYKAILEEARDESHLECYSVDNEKTKDFDDAISIEKTKNGYTVRLHISDVASFVTDKSKLFSHLEQHISSVYTLDKIYHLMPPALSTDFFSLRQGERRRVMSFAWAFDEDCKLLGSKIYFSQILVKKNITYNLAEEWIVKKKRLDFFKQSLPKIRKTKTRGGGFVFEKNRNRA
jgi:exoribonuclease R